ASGPASTDARMPPQWTASSSRPWLPEGVHPSHAEGDVRERNTPSPPGVARVTLPLIAHVRSVMSIFDRLAKTRTITAGDALPGRADRPFALAGTHTVLGTPIEAPAPDGYAEVVLGTGCFWGTEEIF